MTGQSTGVLVKKTIEMTDVNGKGKLKVGDLVGHVGYNVIDSSMRPQGTSDVQR